LRFEREGAIPPKDRAKNSVTNMENERYFNQQCGSQLGTVTFLLLLVVFTFCFIPDKAYGDIFDQISTPPDSQARYVGKISLYNSTTSQYYYGQINESGKIILYDSSASQYYYGQVNDSGKISLYNSATGQSYFGQFIKSDTFSIYDSSASQYYYGKLAT
jgi:hypothetical protein